MKTLMWHLMQKRSLWFAIFNWIAVCVQLISCSNGFGIHSNGSSYLLKKKWSAVWTVQAVHAKKNCHPFEWLGPSVRKKLSAVWVAWAIRAKENCSLLEQLRLSVWKKLSAVRTAWAIRSKKIGSHSKVRSSYLFKEKFSPVSIPEQFPRQPLVSNDLLFSRHSWMVPLWTLFTNVSWIVTPLFLPLPHLFRHPFSHSISNGLVTPSSSVCLPCVCIPCIVYREHFWVRGHIFEVNGIVVQ